MLYPLSYGSGTSARSTAHGSALKSTPLLRRGHSPEIPGLKNRQIGDKEILVLYRSLEGRE
jgi:hypothetical protein